MDFEDEIQKGTPIYMGVIGARTDINQEQIQDILIAILQELGRPPDQLILPSEGSSSIFISDWADSLKIPTQIYEADWRRHQRRAKIFRDTRIQKESTHFIIFLNKRSEYNMKLSERLHKQGKQVFTIDYSNQIEHLIASEEPSQEEAHGSKRGTGKEQGLLQWKQLEYPETQILLIDS